MLIRHARVWSSAGVGEARDLLVRDGRIVPLDPRGQSAAPSTRVIDARGATVLPGLIDAHVHLDTLPGQLPPEIGVPRETVIAITGRQTLASGVTAARVHLSDVATGPGLGRAAESPCHPGPRLSMGGPGLMGGAPSLSVRLMRGVPDATQGRRFVREMAEQGFAWVALHDMHRFEDDVLRAILDEARDVRLRVMAAADAFADLETALRSGVESLEYVNRTTSVYPEPLLAALAAQRERLVLVPPIGYYTRYRSYRRDPAAVQRATHVQFYPPRLAEAFQKSLTQFFAMAPENDIDRSFETLAAKLRQLRATGVALAIGSDSGSPGQFQIDAVWHEMRAWRAAGVSAHDVLIGATVTPARLVAGATGTLNAGDRADLIVYQGDVLDGTFDPARIRTVVKDGVIFVDEKRWVGPPAL